MRRHNHPIMAQPFDGAAQKRQRDDGLACVIPDWWRAGRYEISDDSSRFEPDRSPIFVVRMDVTGKDPPFLRGEMVKGRFILSLRDQ